MSEGGIASIGTGRLGRVVIARLLPGSDLLESLEQIARQEGIKSGIILSGAASLSQIVLRNVRELPDQLPITDANRVYVSKVGALELLSLVGNISEQEGNTIVHAHVTISSGEEDGLAYGGHLTGGCKVFSLAEVAIAEIEGVRLVKSYDEATRGPQLNILPG